MWTFFLASTDKQIAMLIKIMAEIIGRRTLNHSSSEFRCTSRVKEQVN